MYFLDTSNRKNSYLKNILNFYTIMWLLVAHLECLRLHLNKLWLNYGTLNYEVESIICCTWRALQFQVNNLFVWLPVGYSLVIRGYPL